MVPGEDSNLLRNCFASIRVFGVEPTNRHQGAAVRDVRNPATPPPKAADETGRSAQIFLVEAIVRKNGETRRAMARGRDIYAFTAPLVCEAVQRILNGEVRSRGAQAPGAIFDARSYLQALTPEFLTLEVIAD
jgi:hypothetical protein